MFAEELQDALNRKVCLECNRQFTGIVAACPHDGTLLVNVMQDPLIGTVLAGNYEIISIIGQGGMGVVYKGRHALMERIVAIKMLQAQLITDSMSVKRFQQESKAAARIKHPHIIDVYDFGISPTGQPYIVMEFLSGTPLSDVIKDQGQVGVERTIKIMAQACDALEHAHRQGVVHRDLKPSNIVLTKYDEDDDFVKVVDFGVAKLMPTAGQEGQRLTQAGEVCGSPVYMSPEQCMGQELDPRSDVYSMGVVVYETLTGRLPILGKTMVDTMSKHISEKPSPFSTVRPDLYIPERLEAVVFKALEKDPNDRHQSMEKFKEELDFAIPRPGRSQVLRTAPPSVAAVGDAAASRLKKTPIWVGAAALVLALVAGVVSLKMAEKPHGLPQKAVTPAITQPEGTTPTATTKPPETGTAPDKTPDTQVKKPPVAKAPKKAPRVAANSTGTTEEPDETEVEAPTTRRAYSVSRVTSPEDIVENTAPKPDPDEVIKRQERRIKRTAPAPTVRRTPPVKRSGGGGSDPFAELQRMKSY